MTYNYPAYKVDEKWYLARNLGTHQHGGWYVSADSVKRMFEKGYWIC